MGCSNQRPPIITSYAQITVAEQDSTVEFPCRAVGNPPPETFWTFKDTNESVESDNVKVLADGTLVFNRLSWEDMNAYVCNARNAHGETRVESFIYPAAVSLCNQALHIHIFNLISIRPFFFFLIFIKCFIFEVGNTTANQSNVLSSRLAPLLPNYSFLYWTSVANRKIRIFTEFSGFLLLQKPKAVLYNDVQMIENN